MPTVTLDNNWAFPFMFLTFRVEKLEVISQENWKLVPDFV